MSPRETSPTQGERGTLRRAGTLAVLAYPATYRVGASSLGAQNLYRALNELPGVACERIFLDDRGRPPRPARTAESGRDPAGALAILFSVS